MTTRIAIRRGELTTAAQPNGASNVTYTYDVLGQMISKTQGSATATYDWHPPTLVLSYGERSYGGMLVSTESTFAGEGDFVREYRGDKRLHRVGQGISSTTWVYEFDWDAGWTQIGIDHASTALGGNPGDRLAMMVHDPGERIGTILGYTEGAPTTANYGYMLQDQIGSTRKLFDGSKNETGTLGFTPFGQEQYATGFGADKLYKFTGQLTFNDASNHYYFPYRHYDAGIGRWMSRDPLGMVDGPNLYAYVGQGPLDGVDTMGSRRIAVAQTGWREFWCRFKARTGCGVGLLCCEFVQGAVCGPLQLFCIIFDCMDWYFELCANDICIDAYKKCYDKVYDACMS